MNPIFSRRYKGGSRPNIMPTTRQQNYAKSSSNTGSNSSSSTLSDSLATLSLGESGEDSSQSLSENGVKTPSPLSELPSAIPDTTKRSESSNNKRDKGKSWGDEFATRNASHQLAQKLLASKQNMLAHVSLTPHENRQRAKLGSQSAVESSMPSGMRHSLSTETFGRSTDSASSMKMLRSPTVHNVGGGDMALCDIDDDDVDFSEGSKSTVIQAMPGKTPFTSPSPAPQIPRISRPNLNQRISKEPLDMKTWKELKRVVCGNGSFQDGWLGQGFIFDSNVPFGLIQKKGGPCGVLAVVQSLLVRNLLFGSPLISGPTEEETQDECRVEQIQQFLLENGNEDCVESIRRKRVQCLVDAVTEIIWTCAQQRRRDEGLSTKECNSVIMLSDYRIQAETINVSGRLELQHFLQNSIHRFDCIALVYSAVLTRGISGVREDMDFENCSLVGQHGYCSQELINLLCLGRAISNTFDNEIELDGKILRGIPAQCDVGLLSLFEHYDSIKVGSFLKYPRYPVWMICSESHYSVLFSFQQSLCNQNDSIEVDPSSVPSFDLFYYDGLVRQEKVVRLSICLPQNPSSKSGPNSGWGCTIQDYKLPGDHKPFRKQNLPAVPSMRRIGDELIPPLEKCIRTKWHGAEVDWNDTEPIL